MTTELLHIAKSDIALGGYVKIAEYITNSIHIEKGLLSNLIDIVSKYPGKGLLVADTNTIKLLNKEVIDSLEHYIIRGKYNASWQLVENVKAASQNSDFLIALGSGSINDICKHVSHLCGKKYVVFPTAPSMNGYTSENASIIMRNGIKKSINGHLPVDIYADLDVLTNAPRRLINSGFADFMCRSTARVDWLVSHLLLDTEYNELPFIITEGSERVLTENYLGLVKRDSETTLALMQALILSGIGMIIAGGSQPASQGEHIIANTTELLDNYEFLHGERVGVATVMMSRLQRNLCGIRPKFHTTSLDEGTLRRYFAEGYAREFSKILCEKSIDSQKADHINSIIHKKWKQISEFVASKVLIPTNLKTILHNLGTPNTPEHVGWTTEKYNAVANIAFSTRDRFTFLDIAHHARISVS